MRRSLPLANWCCMCRKEGESVDHLLLDCDVAHAFWEAWFEHLELNSGMCDVDYLEEMEPCCSFENSGSSLDHSKSVLHCTLYDWSRSWGFIDCSSFFVFLASLRLPL